MAAHKIDQHIVDKITLMAYKMSPHPCAVIIMDYKQRAIDDTCLCRSDYENISQDPDDMSYDEYLGSQAYSLWHLANIQTNLGSFWVARGNETKARNKDVWDDEHIVLKTPDYPPVRYLIGLDCQFWDNSYGCGR